MLREPTAAEFSVNDNVETVFRLADTFAPTETVDKTDPLTGETVRVVREEDGSLNSIVIGFSDMEKSQRQKWVSFFPQTYYESREVKYSTGTATSRTYDWRDLSLFCDEFGGLNHNLKPADLRRAPGLIGHATEIASDLLSRP